MAKLSKAKIKKFWIGVAHFILWAVANGREQDIRFNVLHDLSGLDGMQDGDKWFVPRTSRYEREYTSELNFIKK